MELPMKILVTGSSGLVGSALIPFLLIGKHDVFKLVRVRADLKPNEVAWDSKKGVIDPSVLEGFDAVVHLAGENLMGKWTEEKKKRIMDSRIKNTQLLCQTLSQLRQPPGVLICASAIGYYGNQGDKVLTEASPNGQGFLADLCEKWEKATQAAVEKNIRTINLRIGMVLSPKGGALKQMILPFQLGLGGQIGDGLQYMSWIAVDDLIGIIYYGMRQTTLSGPVNAVSPYPITNYEFTKTLGAVLHRPTFFSLPVIALRWIFGEMADALLLCSQRVRPAALLNSRFRFEYPKLEEALEYLLERKVAPSN